MPNLEEVFMEEDFSAVDTVVPPTYQQTAFNVTNLLKITQFGVKVKYNSQDKQMIISI